MPVLATVVASVALVWGAVFALRGSLVAGCLAVIVTGACLGHDFLSFDVGPLPLTIDRAALLLLVGAYLVQSRLGRTDPKPWCRADWLLLGLVLLLTISTLATDSTDDQLGQGSPLWRLISGYAIPLVLYWIARQAPLDHRTLGLVWGSMACLGVYLAATGLLEVTEQWWAVFPRHIADPQTGIHFGRARGPMVHSVSYGTFLAVALLSAWTWRGRWGRLGPWMLLALAPLFLASLFFSYTRSVWLGTALGGLVVLALTLRGRVRVGVLGGIVAAGLLLALTHLDDIVHLDRETSGADTARSVGMRGSFAYVSWKMFLDRPLFGFGFGQFPEAKLPYLADRSTDLHLEQIRPYIHHNTFLSVLTETGLVGLTLLLAVLVAWGWAAWQLAHDPRKPDGARAQGPLMLGVLGFYVCQAAFHEVSYLAMDNGLVFFLAGLTVGLARSGPRPGDAGMNGAPQGGSMP